MSEHSLPPSLAAMLDEGALFEEKYRLLRFLGEGSFASVIHARHEAMDRDVALKFLRPDVIKAHPEASERFLNEVRLSSRLTSAHTVTIFDFGQTDEDIPYMVMEYVDGRPLDEVMGKHGALGLKRSIRITIQILESLEEAHAHHIIHRDLKPANIMVGKAIKKNEKGVHVKVLDFGVAKLVEREEEALKTESGRKSTQFIGTPLYMSPEQILGREVGAATDLYSLGLIFFEMATGDEAIKEDNVAQVAQAHLAEEPLDMAGIDQLPSVLAKIVRKATARHRKDRFQSADEFRKALEAALEKGKRKHRKAVATPDSPAEKRDDAEREERTSNVFSGEGYVELPDEDELAEARSPTGPGTGQRPPTPGSGSASRHPSPAPGRGGNRRSSNGAGQTSKRERQRGGGSLELDMDSVQEQRRDIARKRRAAYKRQSQQERRLQSGYLWRWLTSGSVILVSGYVGFAVVGGALSMLAFPMRLIMALLPVGLALLWSVFSDSIYPDFVRRIAIPWARHSVVMVVVAIVTLAMVMPVEAGRSLQDDGLWFVSLWPEVLQMDWLLSLTQRICDLVASLMNKISHLIPWSSP